MITLACTASSAVFFCVYGVYTFCQDISRLARRRRAGR